MIRDAILVAFFSWIGVLIRIGLVETYNHTFIHGNIPGPITKNFYPNVIGTAILGILVSLQTKIKARYPPLYVGLSSGLCGTITTFSGLSEEASLELIDHNITSFFAVLFVGFVCPYWILLVSINMTAYYFPVPPPSRVPVAMAPNSSATSTLPNGTPPSLPPEHSENEDDATGVATAPESNANSRESHKRFYCISFLAAIGIFAMLSLLAALRYPPSYIAFSCLFAPFGALTRWYLATYNIKFPKFPVFTFLVNFFGSLLVAGFSILYDRSRSPTGSAALDGAIYGFCGGLSTTSTFLNEARMLDVKYSVIYVVTSIVVTQAFMLAINGPYFWSQ